MEAQLATLEHGRHSLAGATVALSDSSSTDDAETVDDDDVDGFSRFWDDYFDLIEAAKRKLEEDYREDGPPIGFHFDEPPSPDRAHEVKNAGDKATGTRNTKKKLALGEFEGNVGDDGEIGIRKRKSSTGVRNNKTIDAAAYEEQLQKKRRQEQARAEKKRQEEEKRARREQDKESKKRERLLMKEREREEREQKKRLEREEKEREKELKRKAKEEERIRQAHERELKRLEREKDKERKAEERRRLQEEKRRKNELQRVLNAKMRAARKELQRQMEAGPPDDLDLEWDKLIEEERALGYASDTTGVNTGGTPLTASEPHRPEFPPPTLQLQDTFPQMGDEMGGNLLMVWSFVHSFRNILGVDAFSVDALMEALFMGQASEMLCRIHVGLIRLIQADIEESHYLVVTQGGGGTANFMDRAVVSIASILDEAWGWGFDVDVWRAHINALTWPEILRQLAIAAGRGPRKSKPGRDIKPKLGTEGEDVVVDESGSLRLKMPSRFAPGTVKAAAWQVLAEAGPRGLMIAEIAKRIQKQGLRDLRTSKTPEASVAGGLSRDIVFTRVAPATYALQAVVAHHRRLLQNKDGQASEHATEELSVLEHLHGDCATPNRNSPDSWHQVSPSEENNHSTPIQGEELDASDEEYSEEVGIPGEHWIFALTEKDYNEISFRERLEALTTLCNMALDGPTIRSCLDARLESQSAEAKRKEAEERAEKRARADQAAEHAQRVLLQLGNLPQSPELAPASQDVSLDGSVVESIMTQTLQNVGPCTGPFASAMHWSSNPQVAIRYEPIGLDRRYNRYWKFANDTEVTEDSHDRDPCSSTIFVESCPSGKFRTLESAEQISELKSVLDARGAREGALSCVLSMEEKQHKGNIQAWRERPELDPELLNPGKRQRIGYNEPCWLPSISTFAQRWAPKDGYISNVDFPATDTPILLKLKVDMMRMEEVLAADAMKDWDRLAWAEDTKNCTTLEELRTCLGRLENGLVPEVVSKLFVRNPYIVRGAWCRVKGEVASAIPGKKGEYVYLVDTPGLDNEVEPLAWLPATYAAIALRLLALDAAITYRANVPAARAMLESYKYVQKPIAPELEVAVSASQSPAGSSECSAKGMKIVSCRPIGYGGQIVGSMLPNLRMECNASLRQEFTIQVAELQEAAHQAEVNGSLYVDTPVVTISRSRGGRSGSSHGRGRGRGANSRRKKRSSLALVLDKQEEQDASDDGDLSGLDQDHGTYSHPRNSAWGHEIEDDEDY